MRFISVVLLAAFTAVALAAPPTHGSYYGKHKIVDKQFLQKQKDILSLYKHVHQSSHNKEHVEIYQSYSLQENIENYNNAQYVKKFLQEYQGGLLPKGEIFSVFHKPHLQQAIALFNVLYSANDFKTFYKTAVWARNAVNEGQFIYALSVAVVHRDDTYGIIIPPIYEVYPYYFFNSEVIKQVEKYKQQYGSQSDSQYGSQYKQQYGQDSDADQAGAGFNIPTNYTGTVVKTDPEQSVSYFTEDIGINSFYYYYNLFYPFWLGGQQFNLKNDRRGEQFYYIHQQLLARYYLERLSNGLGKIPFFDLQYPFKSGYYSGLTYSNGVAFPNRVANVDFYFNQISSDGSDFDETPQIYSYYASQDIETRLRDTVDSGYYLTADGQLKDLYDAHGFEVFTSLIESNADSPNKQFYGPYQVHSRQVLGGSYQTVNKYNIIPSALEHYETSLRDPAFWQLYKKIVNLAQKYKKYLPKYSKAELNFEGVQIQGIEVSSLVTFFQKFYTDLNNAIYVNQQESQNKNFNVWASQWRLNHKPFTYNIQVNSDKATQVVVRAFIGPKQDENGNDFEINENRNNFVEFDKFVYNLPAGQHTIERSSHQTKYAPDKTSFQELYNQVSAALNGSSEFSLDATQSYFGFPHRYLLPKGQHGGQVFQFYSIISKYHAPSSQQQQQKSSEFYYPKVGSGSQFVDTYPLGYPFDRPIDKNNFYVTNSYFKDVTIYHKKFQESNVSNVDEQES